ncbi:hypothetical protein V8C35DRAFT_288315 [Trichoderma chlorosporum]
MDQRQVKGRQSPSASQRGRRHDVDAVRPCSRLLGHVHLLWLLQRSRDARPNHQTPWPSRFNAGQSSATVTPGRRATRLPFATSCSIVMRVSSLMSSRPIVLLLCLSKGAHAMYVYPRRDVARQH